MSFNFIIIIFILNTTDFIFIILYKSFIIALINLITY